MNPLLAKFLRSVYRKEPISGFILILGATDAILGGVGGRWSLMSIGLLIALLGIAIRWRQRQQTVKNVAPETARYMLPPSSSRPQLPLLINDKRRGQP